MRTLNLYKDLRMSLFHKGDYTSTVPISKGGLRGLLLCILRVLGGKLFILQHYSGKSAFSYLENHVRFYFDIQRGIIDGVIVYAYPALLNHSARLAVGICKTSQDYKPCNPYLAVR